MMPSDDDEFDIFIMSCLPDIFSRSNYLARPSKVGGVFSVNLRSDSFGSKQTASVGEMRPGKTSRSVEGRADSQRYRQEGMRTSKTRSFYQPCREEGLEERGPACDNLNGKASQQSDLEAISSFNVLKRTALDSLHLARRTLELTQAEAAAVRTHLADLSRSLTSELDAFRAECLEQCGRVTREFRCERRAVLGEGKAISQQLVYLREQVGTAGQVSGQLAVRFEGVVGQLA